MAKSTTGYAAATGMAIGAISSALAARNAAAMQASSLNYQAEMARINAASAERMGERAAQAALASGNRQEQAVMLRTAQIKSSQRTGLANNGVDLSGGSALNILSSTDMMGEDDVNTTHANAARSAWGYRIQALTQGTSMRSEANLAEASAVGSNANSAFAASLMGSAGGVATQWYTLKHTGAFNN